MGGYILEILFRVILKQGNIWDIQKVKQKGYLNKNLKQKENKMGMDIHGLNPKMHKEITDYPTLMLIKNLEKNEEWEKRRDLLDDIPVRDKYWAEEDEYNKENKGIYFLYGISVIMSLQS